MKMTKIESARIIVEQKGDCTGVYCANCFNCTTLKNKSLFCESDRTTNERAEIRVLNYEKAKAYIKRHESKSKKKDHILDTTKKVEEPKPTPLQIAKMIRDNGYSCTDFNKEDGCFNRKCPLFSKPCGLSHNLKTASEENKALRKKLIDDYISANEPVKDCHVNSEYPDPIRVDIPDIFYCPTHQGILRFKRSQIILKDTNNEDCLLKLHDEYPCYRTPEEALQVAKKLWGSK